MSSAFTSRLAYDVLAVDELESEEEENLIEEASPQVIPR